MGPFSPRQSSKVEQPFLAGGRARAGTTWKGEGTTSHLSRWKGGPWAKDCGRPGSGQRGGNRVSPRASRRGHSLTDALTSAHRDPCWLLPQRSGRRVSTRVRPHRCQPRSRCHLAPAHEATPLLAARPSPVPLPSLHHASTLPTPTAIKTQRLPHLTSLLKGVFLQNVLPNLLTQPKPAPDPRRTHALGTHASPARCLLHSDTLSFRAYCLLSTD